MKISTAWKVSKFGVILVHNFPLSYLSILSPSTGKWQWLVRTKAERFTQLLLNLVNLRDLFGLEQVWKKVCSRHPHQFHCYNQNMSFVNMMNQNVAKSRIGIQMKKWWWSTFVWVIDASLQGAWVLHRINKDGGNESLPLLAFQRHVVNAVFLKY